MTTRARALLGGRWIGNALALSMAVSLALTAAACGGGGDKKNAAHGGDAGDVAGGDVGREDGGDSAGGTVTVDGQPPDALEPDAPTDGQGAGEVSAPDVGPDRSRIHI